MHKIAKVLRETVLVKGVEVTSLRLNDLLKSEGNCRTHIDLIDFEKAYDRVVCQLL